jgi:hypothetical protein
VTAEFERVSRLRAEPLTRGWAVDLNYEVFHADASRLRPLIVNALQVAAGGAERPGIIRQNIESFRPLGAWRPL